MKTPVLTNLKSKILAYSVVVVATIVSGPARATASEIFQCGVTPLLSIGPAGFGGDLSAVQPDGAYSYFPIFAIEVTYSSIKDESGPFSCSLYLQTIISSPGTKGVTLAGGKIWSGAGMESDAFLFTNNPGNCGTTFTFQLMYTADYIDPDGYENPYGPFVVNQATFVVPPVCLPQGASADHLNQFPVSANHKVLPGSFRIFPNHIAEREDRRQGRFRQKNIEIVRHTLRNRAPRGRTPSVLPNSAVQELH